MKLDYSMEGEVQISMVGYLKGVLAELPKEMCGQCAIPAAAHLFNVGADSPVLPHDEKDMFYYIVIQLAYLSQQAQLDICMAVAFLLTHVSVPTQEDWNKLYRMTKYLDGTLDLLLRLSISDDGIIE